MQSITKFHNAIKSYRKFALAYTMSCKKGMVAFNSLLTPAFGAGPYGTHYRPRVCGFGGLYAELPILPDFSPACAVMLNKIMYMTSYKMQAEESMRRIDMM
ncbi:MAG: hypothetical protein ACLRJV_17715 [Eubacteriales bacterium]